MQTEFGSSGIIVRRRRPVVLKPLWARVSPCVVTPDPKKLFPSGCFWMPTSDRQVWTRSFNSTLCYTHNSTGVSISDKALDGILGAGPGPRTYVPSYTWHSEYAGPVEPKEPVTANTVAEAPKRERGLRLRPRSRLTRNLEAVGRRVRGWWRDLPVDSDAELALLWMQEYSVDGTKLGMARSVSTRGEDGSVGTVSLVEVHFSSEERASGAGLFVCPELVAELFAIRCFRTLDASTLQSLRGRARLWARDKGVSPLDLALFLPGTLVFASLPQRSEVESLGALRSSAALWSVDVLGALGRGVLKAPTGPRGLWPSIKAVFGGHRDHILEPQSTRLALSPA